MSVVKNISPPWRNAVPVVNLLCKCDALMLGIANVFTLADVTCICSIVWTCVCACPVNLYCPSQQIVKFML